MHLSKLTAKGFKSFASATTLKLEPGITCVVGPNGSGKSNVVDALAWVMGEQGAKSLRGGKMQDVIFAGTKGRAPLGRAEVSLTIDNSDGALPIDYAEVTITRTMFRTGGSEYHINGDAARLLDVQELLSDSGIGREMHVIVGQNQLDAVLRATPEDRRGFIEEAAGILKHRRRKEKALRKLNGMAENLNRVTDLTAEVRRQLGPLGRQAEIAQRAQTIQIDVRDAGLRLLADDLAQIRSHVTQSQTDHAARQARIATSTQQLDQAQTATTQLQEQANLADTEHHHAQAALHRLHQVHDRTASVHQVATERARLLRANPTPVTRPGTAPEELLRQADRSDQVSAQLRAELADLNETLSEASATRKNREAELKAEQDRITDSAAKTARRREWLATLTGRVATATSALETSRSEAQRLAHSHHEASERAHQAQQEFAVREGDIAGVEAGELGLDAEYEAAQKVLQECRRRRDDAKAAHQQSSQKTAQLRARREALELTAQPQDGASKVLDQLNHSGHIVGTVGELLQVTPGHENTVAAALGHMAEAIVVKNTAGALAVLECVTEHDAGRVSVLVTDLSQPGAEPTKPDGYQNHPTVAELLTGTDSVTCAVQNYLAPCLLVPDETTATQLISHAPDWAAITPAGSYFAGAQVRNHQGSAPSQLHIQAALSQTTEELRHSEQAEQQALFALRTSTTTCQEADDAVQTALSKLHESDAALAAVTEQLNALAQTARAATAEAERVAASAAKVAAEVRTREETLAAAEKALNEAQNQAPETTDQPDRRTEINEAVTADRHRETELRLTVRTKQEQLSTSDAKSAALRRNAAREAAAQQAAQAAAEKRHRQATAATHIADVAEQACEIATQVSHRAQEHVTELADRREHLRQLAETSAETTATLRTELAALTDSAHRDEVAHAEHNVRLKTIEERCLSEYRLEPDLVLDEYGPHQHVPQSGPDSDDDQPQLVPYVRKEQEKRLRKAQRALKQLGKVNPLALEEFAALTERHDFLAQQLTDLEKSREDLLTIIAEIDNRVERVFTEAWQDTKREFEIVFDRLFPGGEGRLVLTDPDNMLTTGIDVEARPAGKRVKQLSLLSGGERSLTAVALLVAIFRARPSPFYVLDEVEAALDDANLGRLLVVLEELRETSQLIVITHQKRTMEVADALYGVTMRGDGVSRVLSQRLRNAEPSSAEPT